MDHRANSSKCSKSWKCLPGQTEKLKLRALNRAATAFTVANTWHTFTWIASSSHSSNNIIININTLTINNHIFHNTIQLTHFMKLICSTSLTMSCMNPTGIWTPKMNFISTNHIPTHTLSPTSTAIYHNSTIRRMKWLPIVQSTFLLLLHHLIFTDSGVWLAFYCTDCHNNKHGNRKKTWIQLSNIGKLGSILWTPYRDCCPYPIGYGCWLRRSFYGP